MSLLALISSHSLRSSMYLLLPSKLAFRYSSAWVIVPHIMPVVIFGMTISYAI